MNNIKEKGVVLIEAIVAVGVLSVIFTAAISLYMASITGTRITNDQMIATFLAQDMMEQIIAKKQENYILYKEVTDPWLRDFGGCVGNNCAIDYVNKAVSDPGGIWNCGANCPVYFGSVVAGEYSNTSGGSLTHFERWFTIAWSDLDGDGAEDEARVTVVVEWHDGATPIRYELKYNIYKNPNID